MTGDFDYFDESEDVRTYPDASDVQSITDEYRTRARKYAKIGIILICTPFLIFVVTLLPPGEFADLAFYITLGGTVFLAMVGVVVLIGLGTGTSMLINGFEILERVSPSNPVIIKRYAVTKVKDVYLLAHGLSGYIIAVMFRGSPQVGLTSKIKLPRAFYRWGKKVNTDRVEVFRREGVFSIPSPNGEYLEGDAVLYGVAYVPSKYRWPVPEFSKEDLMSIVESITEDANRLY